MPKKKTLTRAFSNLIKVQDLRMIVALEEHRTILNAANMMGLSQPAVTKRLQDLEKDLGITLFHRLSRGVEATPYGEIIIKHAHIILNQLRSAEGEVSDLSAGLGGRLRVGIPASASTNLVSDSIIGLLEKRKNVQITLVEDYNIRLIPALKRGNLDVIIGRLPNENQYDDINTEIFYQESLQVVVRKGHPLADKKAITAADLLEWHWLMPPQDSIMFKQIESFFRKNGQKLPETSIYSLSHSGALHILQRQNLISAFPCESIADDLASGKIKALDVSLFNESTGIGIVTRRNGFSSPASEMFIDIVRNTAKKGYQ